LCGTYIPRYRWAANAGEHWELSCMRGGSPACWHLIRGIDVHRTLDNQKWPHRPQQRPASLTLLSASWLARRTPSIVTPVSSLQIVVLQRYILCFYWEGNNRLYIYNVKNKLIYNQLGSSYRFIGINSDGSAWFLICTSLISQHR
jgi:hypothetical protein